MDYTIPWLDELQYPHHRQAVLNLRDEFQHDPDILALVLGGSVCHGYARPDSDVDCLLIVTEEEFRRRQRENKLVFSSRELAGYEGGYIDAKYHSVEYIEKVAAYGAEPARFAFRDARIVFTRIEGLENLLERAAAYPEEGRENRIVRFHAQLDGMRWFLSEGVKRGDAFTIHWAAANLVLFGCRMLLAHNRVLFPCTKSMTHQLKRCAELPEGIFEKIDALLKIPGMDTAEAFCRGIKDWREWEQSPESWSNLYMADSELRWLKGEAPIADI